MRVALLLIALVVVTTGCDTTVASRHEEEPVVEAYLAAGSVLPRVRLTTTAAIDGVYDADRLGIRAADVRIARIDGDAASRWSVAYRAVADSAGIYAPTENRTVEPGATYRLDVALADGTTLDATTIVPGAFEIVSQSSPTVVYQGADQFETELTPSSYPGRDAIYIITIESLDPRTDRLTPFYLDAIYDIAPGDPYDPDTLDVDEIADFVKASSPPLNEANYRKMGEATLKPRLPWFSVVFYGPIRVQVSSIDDNLYDFIRFQNAQSGGSTLSPGEIPNILDGVNGGVGVFGSYTPVSSVIEVLEPPR